jgi:hypothetical protein
MKTNIAAAIAAIPLIWAGLSGLRERGVTQVCRYITNR